MAGPDYFSLEGKTAILTGGAGTYGKAILEALSSAGAETYICSRNLPELEKTAAAQREKGFAVQALPLDLSDEATIIRCRDEVLARSGKIDILINNSVYRMKQGGMACDAHDFNLSMQVNATGLFLMTRTMGKVMAERGSGSIINIGSIMGMIGVENHNYDGTDMNGWAPDYFFNKAGMINFTRFCASYYGTSGVRVNCISPGGLSNPSHPNNFVENYRKRTQLGRLANPQDIHGAIVFLASDASLYVTGINLPVDGGYTAK